MDPPARFACGLQPAPIALLDVGHAAPRPPGLRPLCAFAHGPLQPADQEEGCGGLSTRSVGSARPQGLRAKSPPHAILKKGCLASAARQAEGGTPVVKVAPEWVHVRQRAALSTCAHVGPACPAGRLGRAVVRPGSRFFCIYILIRAEILEIGL